MPEPKRVILVTGATDGIGLETARALASQGHRVVLHGRTPDKAGAAARLVLRDLPTADLATASADLGRLGEVRALAAALRADHPRLDVLLHNAGVFTTSRQVTPDGLELTLAVNHLAPFLLTHLLLDRIREARGRVVVVSSGVHGNATLDLDDLQGARAWDGYGAYARSKLCNVLFAAELAARLAGSGATANSLHPGVVGTKLLRAGFAMEGPDSLAQGAATSVYLASSPEVEGVTGRYFVRKKAVPASRLARKAELRAALWAESERLCGLAPSAGP
ncbi:MAG: SDR family NAD(P)-dependent oxidoreductase [Anaeromyxobacteraceae bacterium]|nr:SDR family NAD(P)-dependent oxidoreductase [Anaeromyxobacteraceae bacterium]